MADDIDPYELSEHPDDDFAEASSDAPSDAIGEVPVVESDIDAHARGPSAWRAHEGHHKAVPVDEDGRLIQNMFCRSCDYNLRGQLPGGTCPECGAAVADALTSDQLIFANPRWLEQLKLGVSFLTFGTLALIPLSCVIGMGMSMLGSQGMTPGVGGTKIPIGNYFGQIISGLLQFVIYGYGCWLVTVPEPGYEEVKPAPRVMARWLIPSASIFGVLVSIVGMFMPTFEAQMAVGYAGYLGGLAYLVGFVGLLIYLARLAARSHEVSLASQTRTVMWGFVGLTVLSLPAVVVINVVSYNVLQGQRFTSGPGALVMGCGGCILGLGYIGFFIWWLVLMFFYRNMIAGALRYARG